MVKVPDMTGKDYVSAAKKLSKLGFDVIRKDQSSNTVAVGNIISQSIAAGVEVKPKQTTITLVVSKGKTVSHKKNTIKLKDLRNYSLKGAQDYAKDNHLTLQATQKYSDTVEKGMVISMSPEAGTEVESGSTITISVSKGPKQNQNKDSSVTKTFTVNYKAPSKDQSGSDKDKGNHVQIYISDDDHSLSNIYRDLYIKHDMSFSIPFSLKDGSGELRVVRDGQTVLNEKVTK